MRVVQIGELQWRPFSSVGAKLINYHITRGIYDFTMQTEAENFNQIAAMNLKAKAAGTVSKLDVLESLNIDEVREVAKSVNFQPPKILILIKK